MFNTKTKNLSWFKDAKFGMFVHYGLYSLLEKGEWVQYWDKIPVAEYAKLYDKFTAEKFDAEYITDLALRAGMKYINLTCCHHESFCLWDSRIEPFNSMNACGRDLVKELSEACAKKGLGFFAYYTFMLNWKHPYFLPMSVYEYARPHYDKPQPEYLYKKKEDFKIYLDYMQNMMDELLSKYKITGIWLDLISAWYALGKDYIPIDDIYARIRKKHPGVLISWKQGATGTEDFAAPEFHFGSMEENIRKRHGDEAALRAKIGFEGNKNKHNEICSSIQKGTWGYSCTHENRTAAEIYGNLGNAIEHNCNLLMNIGPMPDGSIDKRHEEIMLKVGAMIKKHGYPASGKAAKEITGAGAE